MDISFFNATEVAIQKEELPTCNFVTIIIKYGDGKVQEIEVTGKEYDVLPIVIE